MQFIYLIIKRFNFVPSPPWDAPGKRIIFFRYGKKFKEMNKKADEKKVKE